MRFLLIIPAVAILAGCATDPDNIAAADIGPNPYTGQSCRSLAAEETSLTANLENLSANQRQARSGDTVGVILLGLPLSSMSGNDVETEIAVTRGRLQAVDEAQQARGCS